MSKPEDDPVYRAAEAFMDRDPGRFRPIAGPGKAKEALSDHAEHPYQPKPIQPLHGPPCEAAEPEIVSLGNR